MKTLEFMVDGQTLSQGRYDNLIAGSCGYLEAHFTFSADWSGMAKVVTFRTDGKETYVALKGNRVLIPAEVLKYNNIDVFVEGRRNGCRLNTNGVRIVQKGGIV